MSYTLVFFVLFHLGFFMDTDDSLDSREREGAILILEAATRIVL